MGVLAKKLSPVRLVFDIRGFMPEEYVDAGVWPPNGFLYRLTKRVERRLFTDADAFVVLTERARRHLFGELREADASGRPLAVIPCCVDLREFVAPSPTSVAHAKASLGVAGRRVYVYAGQLSGWYLDDVLVAFLARARALDPTAFAMILTPSPAEPLTHKLAERGLDSTSLLVRSVRPDEVPRLLMAADVGLSFIKPCFSKLSSSPTKVGEYLAAGLPVISTAGIGDVDELLRDSHAGLLLKGSYEAAFDEAISGIDALLKDTNIRSRLHAVAREALDLELVGATRYRRLYERLAATWSAP
jgi:glycosyltransferase involved in cell wall biosynthesis